MTETEKLELLKLMTDEADESVLRAYLYLAAVKFIARAYPFRTDVVDVPDRYAQQHVEIAAYLINKRGGEGETGHTENGISRQYEAGSVPDSMLKGITPCAGVLK